MSDLLLSSKPINTDALENELKFTDNTHVESTRWPGLWGVVSRIGREEIWQSANDQATGVSVAIGGRLTFEESEWAHAENLDFEGGLAARLVLERWLTDPDQVPLWLNGGFAVAIYDPRHGELILITDRLGAYPFYRYQSDSSVLLGSHADVLASMARQQELELSLDLVTMADALHTGAAQQPYTYYRQIQQLDPATVYRFKLESGQYTRSVYWGRDLAPAGLSDEEMTTKVAEALLSAVKRRTSQWCGKTGLFLSGGADSRAILFGADEPASIDTVTFFDSPNPELDVAKQLAQAAGSTHYPMQREFDHYGTAAEDVVQITAGYWSIKDAHYHGFHPELSAMGFETLMTGCYTDYLLKGLAYNVSERKVLGRPVPVKEMSTFNYAFYQPFSPIADEWKESVNARLAERFPAEAQKNYDTAPWQIEDLRVRPISREADGMGRSYLWRALAWDPIMVDSDIADCFLMMTPDQKMNAKIFRRAVMRIVGQKGGDIRNANDHVPLDASDNQRIYHHFRKKVVNKLNKVVGGDKKADIATDGSWPDFAVYVRTSALIKSLWENPDHQQHEILGALLGFDPWQKSMEYWGSYEQVGLFLRLLTLKIWLGKQQVS